MKYLNYMDCWKLKGIKDCMNLFSDECQIYNEKGISELYDDIFLKIKGEVVFYEDIYDLLPEEHNKPFEKIIRKGIKIIK